MAKYRVKPGRVFGAGGKFPAGSVVEIDPKDAAPFLDLLIPLSVGNKPVTPLKNELNVVLEGDLTQTILDPEEFEEMGKEEGEIDLPAEAEAEIEEKKPSRRKTKAK